MEAFDPVILAKLVVIQTRFQELYHDLLEYPNLIQELELRATHRKEITPLLIKAPIIPPLHWWNAMRHCARSCECCASALRLPV